MQRLSDRAGPGRALTALLVVLAAAVLPAMFWGKPAADAAPAANTVPSPSNTSPKGRPPSLSTTTTTPLTTTAPSPTTEPDPPLAPPTQVPTSVQDLTGTAVADSDTARVTWDAPADGWGTDASDTVSVLILDLTDGWVQFGSIATCAVGGVCDGSLTLRGLVDGHQYLAIAWPTNVIGSGTPVASNAFTASTGCAVSACVTVDATADGEPFRNIASGLNANDIIPQNGQLLSDVAISWWRLSSFGLPGGPNPPNYAAIDQARAKGAKVIEILSDDWWQQTYPSNNGWAPNPADDWDAWDSFVKAKVAQSLADGHSPDYWEVWNEPGGDTPPVVGGPLTLDEQLQLYEHTWHDIRSVDPQAKIAYASTVGFGPAPGLYTGAANALYLPIPALLDFIQSRGLDLDLLTWHEDGAPQKDTTMAFPAAAGDRIATARRWLDGRGMTATKINIDEYLPPSMVDNPAWNLAYDAALETSAADGAVRSCWARIYTTGPWGPGGYLGCNWGQLDNLADIGGNNPMAAWWVLKLYSNLRGHVVPSPSSSSYVPTLATVDGTTTTVLLGQATTCSGEIRSATNPFCPATWTSAPTMTVSVRVHLPDSGTWRLTETDVPNVADVLPALPATTSRVVRTDATGWATVSIAAPDGAVTQLQFTPS